MTIEIPLAPGRFLRATGLNEDRRPLTKNDALGREGATGFSLFMRRLDLEIDGDVTSEMSTRFQCEFGRLRGRNIVHCVDDISRPTFIMTFVAD